MKGLSTLLLTLALAATSPAVDQSPAEAKLRENLRSVMLQVRTMQAERDALQVAKTQLEQEKKTLTERADELTKQAIADQQKNDKEIADLKARSAEQATQIAALNDSVQKWTLAQKQAADLAAKKEDERAKLAGEGIELRRKVADQQRKNTAMFQLGNEILTRYEKFGLGTALTAREPFVGTTRVKLQNYVQDYADKLEEQRLGAPPAKAAASAKRPSADPGTAKR